MRHKFFIIFVILIVLTFFNKTYSQTKCIWIEKSENGVAVQKIGISVDLVKLLARPNANFDIGDVNMTYDSLLTIYDNGSKIKIKDNIGSGETEIYGGKFNEKMKESSDRHNYLFIENSDNGKEAEVSKFKAKSLEAVGVLLAMIVSKDLDKDIERIESALDQGGVFYIRDFKKDSRLWIYVN